MASVDGYYHGGLFLPFLFFHFCLIKLASNSAIHIYASKTHSTVGIFFISSHISGTRTKLCIFYELGTFHMYIVFSFNKRSFRYCLLLYVILIFVCPCYSSSLCLRTRQIPAQKSMIISEFDFMHK